MNHDGSKAAVIKSTVFEDNNVALAKPKAVKLTPFNKHISVKYHSFNNHCGKGSGITLVKVDILLQNADI